MISDEINEKNEEITKQEIKLDNLKNEIRNLKEQQNYYDFMLLVILIIFIINAVMN